MFLLIRQCLSACAHSVVLLCCVGAPRIIGHCFTSQTIQFVFCRSVSKCMYVYVSHLTSCFSHHLMFLTSPHVSHLTSCFSPHLMFLNLPHESSYELLHIHPKPSCYSKRRNCVHVYMYVRMYVYAHMLSM